ncbi:MAG: cytochrome c [Alphaproteobacteria bacterium]|nr:cytochrome c [Alphaproteobacteria bacterium]
MRDLRRMLTHRATPWIVAGTASVAVATAAFGLPWDIDMADSQTTKGYERDMGTLPDGVVAQPSVESPKTHVTNFKRGSPEGQALVNPLAQGPETLARGEKMYQTYCSPCHGKDGANLGPVAQPGRVPGVVPLAGAAGVAKLRTDGWLYLTIRNGGAVMPPYDWALSDQEMWSIVSYVRTLNNAKYVPPVEAP